MHLYDDNELITGLSNTAEDNSFYEDCINGNIYPEINANVLEENNCAKDDDGHYYFCQGIAWSFDVLPVSNQIDNNTISECSSDSLPVCIDNVTYSYTPCLDGQYQKVVTVPCLDNNICNSGECISNTCSTGETLNETCPSGFSPDIIVDKWICGEDGVYEDNKPTELCNIKEGTFDLDIIMIGAIGIISLLGLFYFGTRGRH